MTGFGARMTAGVIAVTDFGTSSMIFFSILGSTDMTQFVACMAAKEVRGTPSFTPKVGYIHVDVAFHFHKMTTTGDSLADFDLAVVAIEIGRVMTLETVHVVTAGKCEVHAN